MVNDLDDLDLAIEHLRMTVTTARAVDATHERITGHEGHHGNGNLRWTPQTDT